MAGAAGAFRQALAVRHVCWRAAAARCRRLGSVIDLSGRRGPDRIVRAEVIAALVLGESKGDSRRVSAVRLAGAVIPGELNLAHGQLRRLR